MRELTSIGSTVETGVDRALTVAAAVEAILESYLRGGRRIVGEKIALRGDADRRHQTRLPIDFPFYLYPLKETAAGIMPDEAGMVQAVARDLSSRGIGFRCDEPLKESSWIAVFDCWDGMKFEIAVEIRWQQKKTSRCYLFGALLLECWSPEAA